MKRKEVLDKLDRIGLFLTCERIDHAWPGLRQQDYWEACLAALLAIQEAQRQVRNESHTQPTGD